MYVLILVFVFCSKFLFLALVVTFATFQGWSREWCNRCHEILHIQFLVVHLPLTQTMFMCVLVVLPRTHFWHPVLYVSIRSVSRAHFAVCFVFWMVLCSVHTDCPITYMLILFYVFERRDPGIMFCLYVESLSPMCSPWRPPWVEEPCATTCDATGRRRSIYSTSAVRSALSGEKTQQEQGLIYFDSHVRW